MADVSPLIPAGRQVIESYGEGRFRISGVVHEGSVIVVGDRTIPWSVTDFDGVTAASFDALDGLDVPVDVLLLGCGTGTRLPSRSLRDGRRARGMVLEPMDTGAACRTFNVLMAEDRLVAAALIAVE